jgi:hypothetical protein
MQDRGQLHPASKHNEINRRSYTVEAWNALHQPAGASRVQQTAVELYLILLSKSSNFLQQIANTARKRLDLAQYRR